MVKNVPKSKVRSLQHPRVSKLSPKVTKPQKQDLFTIYNQSIEKYFNAAKKTTATYLQSVTDLQQKIIESWKKSMDSAISLQQEFAHESKMIAEVPDETVKVINDIAEQTNQSQELQNKMLLASIDAIRQNIKSFNHTVKTFSEMNKKLADSYGSQMVFPQIDPKVFKSAISEFRKIIQDVNVEQPLITKKEVKR
jgi:hypothetical protein